MTALGKWAPLKLIAIVALPHASPLVIAGEHTAHGLNGKLATKLYFDHTRSWKRVSRAADWRIDLTQTGQEGPAIMIRSH
jgi:hypothetical protein